MSERRQHWRLAQRASVAAGLLLLLGCAQLPQSGALAAQVADCRMAEEDERWLTGALRSWPIVAKDYLKIDPGPLPQIVSYDVRCSYVSSPNPEGGLRWSAAAHEGEITLPNGAQIPPAPNASNAVLDGTNFIVMSLPSIWKAVAPPSEVPLAWRLEGIMFHELAHAYQAASSQLSFPRLHSELGLPESVSGQSVQERFEDNPDYVRAYESERDLLFRAAAAPDDREARSLACQALDLLRKRRADHFTDDEIPWSVVDELSLTTEGLGDWISYTWLIRGRDLAPSVVLPKFRGSWSQEEGLAAFLVIDRLVPGWQRLALAPNPETVEPLLARACGR